MGDENTIDEQYKRTLCTKKIYENYYDKERHVKTWKEKDKPKSSWYRETEYINVYGVKK
jgi:N-acetyl-gamma-glutamylphosphate reductase